MDGDSLTELAREHLAHASEAHSERSALDVDEDAVVLLTFAERP